ncbi:DUF72 domain-containing protein [Coprothermobacter platensis]|uniref:DUF72 domain-containing protein n=1 Tax=Coprothermobacter platensis TaxID=108819 RepID=UPI00035C63AC|nr:DUF72 domain-containing protein [Coprothermobacter platensis]
MLPFYAKSFNTVEINNTFYHVPIENTVKKWLSNLPVGFVFSIKGNRNITHFKRLTDVSDLVKQFYKSLSPLGEHLAVVLWQLPPSLKKDMNVLKSFLDVLDHEPKGKAIEFRHQSWVDPEVMDVLKVHNVSFVVSHGDNYPLVINETTANFVYVRLHGYPLLYRSGYSQEQLIWWREYIQGWLRQGKDVFVYFNNDAEGYAVENALLLKQICA